MAPLSIERILFHMATRWRAAPVALLTVYALGCAHPNAATPQDRIVDGTTVAKAPDTSRVGHNSPSTVTAVKDRVGPNEPVEMALLGNVAGLEIRQSAGGGVSIQIHGPCSFYSNCEPLYVLDGTPIQPGPTGSIAWLNPHDIESIEVLKDPSQTALYGVRGGNGVIIIKTKQALIKHKP